MKNLIGRLHFGDLNDEQIELVKANIKKMLVLDTIEIIKERGEFYEISTDDAYIVDFKISHFGKKLEEISMVKYRVLDEDGNRDEQGGCMLTCPPIECSKKI